MTGELTRRAALEEMEAVEAERRRLAALLESSVIDALALLLAQAHTYEQTMAAHPPARVALSVLTGLIRQTLQQVRDLQSGLYPGVLEALGLEAALETLADQEMRARGLRVHLALQRLRERPSFQVELALFRAAQEALERAGGRAHAAQVFIRLECHDARLRLTLADDGAASSGIEELEPALQRVEQLGGLFQIETDSRGRFEMVVEFPLQTPDRLTAREMDVLHLLAEGLSNKEIAARLHLRPRTVNFHLDNIYSKLGVSSRTGAVIYAVRQGWLRDPR